MNIYSTKGQKRKDPYTLIFLGNFYYDIAIQNRVKEDDFKRYMREALNFYVSAFELDKYNAYAAIGIANVFSEYSLTNYSLDIYKSIHEKQANNTNAFANEAIILMNDQKFEKAAIIINKLLKKFYHGKHPKFENILAKIYMELHDYEKAFKYYEAALNENGERLELRLDVGILCLKLNLLEEARKKLDPNKFDDEY